MQPADYAMLTHHDTHMRYAVCCRYCRENSSAELEQLLHCDGIWLHALRYTGPPVTVAAPHTAIAAEEEHQAAGDGLAAKDAPTVQVKPRWSFQAPYPAWAEPFGYRNAK
jgi:hypothetical protein